MHMYHSIQLTDKYMLLRRYYTVKKDMIQSYGNVTFALPNNVVVPFAFTTICNLRHPSNGV